MAINIVQNVVPYWHENCIFPPLTSLVGTEQKPPVDTWWALRQTFVGHNGRKPGNWRKMGFCFSYKRLRSLIVTSIWGHEMLGFRMGRGDAGGSEPVITESLCVRHRSEHIRSILPVPPLLGIFTSMLLVRHRVWEVGSCAIYFAKLVIARVRSLTSILQTTKPKTFFSMTISAEGPGSRWEAREPICTASENHLIYKVVSDFHIV